MSVALPMSFAYNDPMMSRASIDELTSAEPKNYRSARYRGDEQAVRLDEIDEGDREVVVALYQALSEMQEALGEGRASLRSAVAAVSATHELPALVERVRHLGENRSDDRIAQALHDIRGGSLSACLLHVGRLLRGDSKAEAGDLAFMTRDQLKMMRTIVSDVDVAARERDLSPNEHSVSRLTDALAAFTAELDGQRVGVDVDVEIPVASAVMLAASCTELGAIDRVAYNLLNNAARFSARSTIQVFVAAIGGSLRIVIANEVREDQQRAVRNAIAEDRGALFGDFTTGGTGYGLRIVSELVGHAYGVADRRALTAEGYIGAKLVRETFVSWFFWPLL